jgi:hypothetical protein
MEMQAAMPMSLTVFVQRTNWLKLPRRSALPGFPVNADVLTPQPLAQGLGVRPQTWPLVDPLHGVIREMDLRAFRVGPVTIDDLRSARLSHFSPSRFVAKVRGHCASGHPALDSEPATYRPLVIQPN